MSHKTPVVISVRFLSIRITIADLLHAGRSIRAIAMELGRSPSTVSREIRRNITNALETTASSDGSAQCRASTELPSYRQDRSQS
ncbi:helix-turn-helix domain-containing protein [Arthrobacter sp. MPF02]|uniref:helix-turn-helix domain-containing protein n=1 Tax=Arthrobacter sp. MPF02 TaxID=3388492 RepID=UPI00398473EF